MLNGRLFFLFFNFHRLPFDWKNPFGYLAAFALQYCGQSFLLFGFANGASAAIGAYMFIISMINDIEISLKLIGKSVKSKDQMEMLKTFVDTVQFHGIVKQLSQRSHFHTNMTKFSELYEIIKLSHRLIHDISELSQPGFMAVISWSMIAICSALVILHKEIVQYFISLASIFSQRMIII